MTPRDRVLTSLRRQRPDCVPHNLRPSPEMIARLQDETGTADFAEHFGHDIRYAGAEFPADETPQLPPEHRRLPIPTADAWQRVNRQVSELQRRGLAVCGGYACGVFEQAKSWLGDARTLTDMYEDRRGLRRLLDRITEGKIAVYAGYAQSGVDIVWIGDDLGTQRSLVMSPGHYREWYRPRHEEIVRRVRQAKPDVMIAFHCCGHVTPLIPDLIEIGVDCLEAVQAEAMDIAALKREFGRDLSFWGGVGAQSVLARPSPDAVKDGVRRTLETMSPGGGYIAAPCHTLTEEVPWAHVLAFHEAVAEFNGQTPSWPAAHSG